MCRGSLAVEECYSDAVQRARSAVKREEPKNRPATGGGATPEATCTLEVSED